uniref:Uncharacterized protein n=1 Tax=viral metagenome TaxID=1070528 RepID=A0A2V0RJ17_9ZZZZ
MIGHFPSVILLNGSLLPGRIHSIVLSDAPLDRNYSHSKGIYIDENLRDIGEPMITLLKDYNVKYLSLKRDNVVVGRSWEMAATQALLGKQGTYSGTVEQYDSSTIRYGHVPGLSTKRILSPNVITYENLEYVSLSR